MLQDQDTAAHWPITDETTDRRDTERMFGWLSYHKGASLARMMEAVLSRATFNRGITQYLTNLAYRYPAPSSSPCTPAAVQLQRTTCLATWRLLPWRTGPGRPPTNLSPR